MSTANYLTTTGGYVAPSTSITSGTTWVNTVPITIPITTGTTTTGTDTTFRMTFTKESSVNITTRTIELIDGHVGQVLYNNEIIWQSKRRYRTAGKASAAAMKHRRSRIVKAFA